MDQKGSAAILSIKSLAGAAPEMNLKNPPNAEDKADKWGIHPSIESQSRYHQESNNGVLVAPLKRLMSSKTFNYIFNKPN